MTPEQAEWLKEYHRMWSRYHLAMKLGISENTLGRWLSELGLKKKKDGRRTVPVIKKAIKPVEKKVQRPPAVYSNISREEHIEMILNKQI